MSKLEIAGRLGAMLIIWPLAIYALGWWGIVVGLMGGAAIGFLIPRGDRK